MFRTCFAKTAHHTAAAERTKRRRFFGSAYVLPFVLLAATIGAPMPASSQTAGVLQQVAPGLNIPALPGLGTGTAAGAGCLDASGNPLPSVLDTAMGQIASRIMPTINTALGSALGGLGGLGGGILGGILGGEVRVRDERNIAATKEQTEVLKKILAVQNISCATLQRILASLGGAGPAGSSSNPMVNLPLYAGKVFALYRDTTMTAKPGGQFADTPRSTQAGGFDLVGNIQNMILPSGAQETATNIAGALNTVLSNPRDIGSLAGAVGTIFNAFGQNQAAQNLKRITDTLNQIMGAINQVFGGGLPRFPNPAEELQATVMNIFNASGNQQLQNILQTALSEKNIPQVIQRVLQDTLQKNNLGGLSTVFGSIVNGKFNVIRPEQIAGILTEMLRVTPTNCPGGNVDQCMRTTGVLRSVMGTTVAVNTVANNSARSQNLQTDVRELIYGVEGSECPASSTDPKCISLMRMMTASSNLREDIQTNTAAVLTGLSFQLKELEALSESNIIQATPQLLTASALNAETVPGN